MTLPELVGDYIAKKLAYNALLSVTDPADPIAHELARRAAFDAYADASEKVDEARRAAGNAIAQAAE